MLCIVEQYKDGKWQRLNFFPTDETKAEQLVAALQSKWGWTVRWLPYSMA